MEGIFPIKRLCIRKIVSRIREIVAARYSVFETAVHKIQREALDAFKGGLGRHFAEPFRNYGAFSLVVSSALLVSITNVTQEQGSESPVFGSFRDTVSETSEQPRKRFAMEQPATENLSLVPLSKSTSAVDLNEKTPEEDQSVAFQSGALLSAQADASIAKDPEEEGGVSIYTVVEGDTVSGIAAKHGITVNTILWANDLDNVDSIKPGDQIFILPVAGLSHTVVAGETIDSISAKYKADREKIIAFNGLPANGEIKVGDSIIIPDGYKETPRTAPAETGIARRQYASSSSAGDITDLSGVGRKLEGKAGAGHKFPYGYCTWYVAQKRFVPWGGNAGTWLYHARAMGYRTGKAPARGAIVVTTENRYYGHVALVESVGSGTITVSEMNYRGWGKVDRRVLSSNSRAIKGYIY